jgi:hypothetical protein
MSEEPNNPIDEQEEDSGNKDTKRLRSGFGISLIVHAIILALLIIIPYQILSNSDVANNSSETAKPEKTEEEKKKEQIKKDLAKLKPEDDGELVPKETVLEKVEEFRKVTESLSEEEKQEKLDAVGQQLENLSSEEAVSDIANKLSGYFETEKRASAPRENVSGTFESNTSQIFDVKKTFDENGSISYIATLVDAKGRTMDIPLGKEDGASLYQTFQTLKKFPLAQKVYRDIAMPLLDKMAAADKELEKTKKLLEEKQAQEKEKQVPQEK